MIARVAVIGTESSLGQHVMHELRARSNIELTAVPWPPPYGRDLPTGERGDASADDEDLIDRLRRHDVVIHLALPHSDGNPRQSDDSPREWNESPAHRRFLSALAEAGLERLVATGTCQEYGLCFGPVKESSTTRPVREHAVESVNLFHHLERTFAATGGSFLWARLFNLFGHGQLDTSLWGSLLAAIQRGDSRFPMSDGAQLHDYLHVEDASRLLCELALNRSATGVVNIGSGRPQLVRALAESWVAAAGGAITLDFGAAPNADFESPAYWADISRLQLLLDANSESFDNDRIPYTAASTTVQDAEAAYTSVLTHVGPRYTEPINAFQEQFASFVGADLALATSSCTGALELVLAAIGVGRGSEVILADTNWVATVAPIVHLGATPVFVDIDPESWCISPAEVREAIGPRTRAIIATHLYGNNADVAALVEIADAHGIPVIEDAAEAIGTRVQGRHVGTLGLAGVFSFHGSKTISTGEGGMIVTNDSALYGRLRILADHGRDPQEPRQFWPSRIGYKFKMAPVLAAIGQSQMRRIDMLLAERRRVLAAYRLALESPPQVVLNPVPVGVEHGAWMPTALFAEATGVRRESLVAGLNRAGIDARVAFWPLSTTPPFRGSAHRPTPHAHSFAEHAINLPSYPGMRGESIARVVSAVKEISRS